MENISALPEKSSEKPVIYPRDQHSVSRKMIDEQTLKVLYRLRNKGFCAYVVGGGVRDLLLGRKPKDFDVVTDATPREVRKIFRNAFLIGRRFRLAHIRFAGGHVVELATFRRKATEEDLAEDTGDHFHTRENIFGTPQEDAFRRDFTINALFYDIATFSIIDYTGGMEDLQQKRLRIIGDVEERFAEDPVRMLRALEFEARLGFHLGAEEDTGIKKCAPLLAQAAPARLRDELMELFRQGVAAQVLRQAGAYGLSFALLAGNSLCEESLHLLGAVDARTQSGEKPDESMALACLYLAEFLRRYPPENGANLSEAAQVAGGLIRAHGLHYHIAQFIRHKAVHLLVGVFRMLRGRGRRGENRFLQQDSIPEVLVLLTLWSQVKPDISEVLSSWQAVVKNRPSEKKSQVAPGRKRYHRPRRRRPRKTVDRPRDNS